MASTKGGFAGLMTQRAKQPEYQLPEGDPLDEPPAPPEPAAVAPVESAPDAPPIRLRRVGKGKPKPAKVQVGTYVPMDDFERLDALSETTGKTKSRLFSEALALLFKHYKC